MSNRASDSVRVGMFWNSPSFRSAVASSSPVIFSRERDVGAVSWGAADIIAAFVEIVVGWEKEVWCGKALDGGRRRRD